MTRPMSTSRENSVSLERQQKLSRIKREHFHVNQSFQIVSSDDIIFLISELSQFYFPLESNVSYTKECNTSRT